MSTTIKILFGIMAFVIVYLWMSIATYKEKIDDIVSKYSELQSTCNSLQESINTMSDSTFGAYVDAYNQLSYYDYKISELYEGYSDPVTGADILTVEDYITAVEHQRELEESMSDSSEETEDEN